MALAGLSELAWVMRENWNWKEGKGFFMVAWFRTSTAGSDAVVYPMPSRSGGKWIRGAILLTMSHCVPILILSLR